MTTRHTIKRGDGYHVYTSDAGTLYLSLTDCDFAVYREGGASGVTVKLSEDLATRLGLIGCLTKRT